MTAGEKAVWMNKAEKHRSMIMSQPRRTLKSQEDMESEVMKKSDRKSRKRSRSKKISKSDNTKKKLKRSYSKLPKDPRKPKRPITAYLFFAQQMRPKIKEKNPEMKGLDITRKVGVSWNETSMAEKEPYLKLEADSRKEYKEAMMTWRKNQITYAATEHSADDEKEVQDVKDGQDLLDDDDDDEDDDENYDDNNDEEDDDDEEDDADGIEDEHEVEIDQSDNDNDTVEIKNNMEKVVQNDSSAEEIKSKKNEQSDLGSKGGFRKDEDKNNEAEQANEDKSSESHLNENGAILKNASSVSNTDNDNNKLKSGDQEDFEHKHSNGKAKKDGYDGKTSPPEQQTNFFSEAMMNSPEVQHRFLFHSRLPNGAPYVGSNPVTMQHVIAPLPGALPFPQLPVVPSKYGIYDECNNDLNIFKVYYCRLTCLFLYNILKFCYMSHDKTILPWIKVREFRTVSTHPHLHQVIFDDSKRKNRI